MPQQQGELVLAQNQYAYVQDTTKGTVQVVIGPFKLGLTSNDVPVTYKGGRFVPVSTLDEAIGQNVTAPEGSYVVLENPAVDNKNPLQGGNAPVSLQTGRKVNLPGPTTFAPWPGQVTTVLEGHQLRSNEYSIVRVYNAKEAVANWQTLSHATDTKAEDVDTGQLLIIKGTEISFFIPPDGFEVVKETATAKYVRKALTLERLEYCILLDEDGDKRYQRGPAVVFPTATEGFVEKKQENGSVTTKFKAIELNDQMGLYIKVIADYVEGGKTYVTGDELFITGMEQRIYYPRPEHALIEYGSDDTSFRRQRYYGIAIPSGEARYVLDKTNGKVSRQLGPIVFLPDPRKEVIVRRVLDSRTVELWYPGNSEAQAYNAALRPLMEQSTNYVADTKYQGAVDMKTRAMNRGTRGSELMAAGGASASIPVGETVTRGTHFTPPPSITLNTKYEGVPTINVWTGYAVQVVNKLGQRKLIKGPATILLEYDETMEMMSLSKGTPKMADNLKNTVYLRTDHNKVSDVISVETKDMVTANVTVSYRVNFEGDHDKWFAVENYVKFLTEHMRSLLRAAVKSKTIKEFIDDSASIVRDTVLGPHKKTEGAEKTERAGRAFNENGMRVYDVEVLGTVIPDNSIATMLMNAQKTTVTQTLQLASKESELILTQRRTEIEKEISHLMTAQELDNLAQQVVVNEKRAQVEEAKVLSDLDLTAKQLTGQKGHDAIRLETKAAQLVSRTAYDTHELEVMKQEAEVFCKKFAVIDPKLVEAIHSLSQNGMLTSLAEAIAPLAVMEQQGVGTTLEKLFHGTGLLNRLNGSLLKEKVEQSK